MAEGECSVKIWTYKVERCPHGLDHQELSRWLSDFGDDGWELVSADDTQSRFIFKRPVDSDL